MEVKICDVALVKEYCGTCGEYAPFIKKPFQTIPFKKIWSCSQDNWEDAFRTWGAFQFWCSVLVTVIANVLAIIATEGSFIGSAIVNIIIGILIGYALAHFGWFAVLKKNGCCCCCFVCCVNAKALILLWGICCILWGVISIFNALGFISAGGVGFVSFVFMAFYAVTLIYMGVCLIRVWKAKGAELAPKDVKVENKAGEAANEIGNSNA